MKTLKESGIQINDLPTLVQIETGIYTYRNKITNESETSHTLYGLSYEGRVYKYNPIKRFWILIEDIDF